MSHTDIETILDGDLLNLVPAGARCDQWAKELALHIGGDTAAAAAEHLLLTGGLTETRSVLVYESDDDRELARTTGRHTELARLWIKAGSTLADTLAEAVRFGLDLPDQLMSHVWAA